MHPLSPQSTDGPVKAITPMWGFSVHDGVNLDGKIVSELWSPMPTFMCVFEWVFSHAFTAFHSSIISLVCSVVVLSEVGLNEVSPRDEPKLVNLPSVCPICHSLFAMTMADFAVSMSAVDIVIAFVTSGSETEFEP